MLSKGSDPISQAKQEMGDIRGAFFWIRAARALPLELQSRGFAWQGPCLRGPQLPVLSPNDF